MEVVQGTGHVIECARHLNLGAALVDGHHGQAWTGCISERHVHSSKGSGMDSPKRVLVLLGDLDTRGVPAVILHAAGIRPDGIVAVDVPRFPRVSDVKHALWRDLRIPCADQVRCRITKHHITLLIRVRSPSDILTGRFGAHQVLQGPWPDTAVLSRDWVHLRKYGVFPGLGGSTRKSTRSSRGKSTLETAQPGELFSTAAPITERVDEVLMHCEGCD